MEVRYPPPTTRVSQRYSRDTQNPNPNFLVRISSGGVGGLGPLVYYRRAHPNLLFLAFEDFLAFFLFKEFLVFVGRFSFLSQGFQALGEN